MKELTKLEILNLAYAAALEKWQRESDIFWNTPADQRTNERQREVEANRVVDAIRKMILEEENKE